MKTPKIFESEYRFCKILWSNEPIKKSEMAKLCKAQLGWERTTTYTVISRLKERGVVNTENSVVTSIVSQAEAEIAAIDEVVDKVFSGSMPSFFAAFVRRAELSEKDQAKFAQLIDTYGEQ